MSFSTIFFSILFTGLGLGLFVKFFLEWPSISMIPFFIIFTLFSIYITKFFLKKNSKRETTQRSIVYLRVSSSQQDINSQLNEILDFANKKGIKIKECPEIDEKKQQ